MTQSTTPPFPRSLVYPETGKLTREGYTFLVTLNSNAGEAAAGTVTTSPGSGLAGGGQVSQGVSLFIADNGVSNAMIRQGMSTSVMGRAFGSEGNVADIQAVRDNVVFSRVGGQLLFTPDPQVDSITVDTLSLTGTPAASIAVVSHSIPIQCDGTTYYVLLSNAP